MAETVLLASAVASTATAQEVVEPDSGIQRWLRDPASAAWSPASLWEHCPHLEPWQLRGIATLMHANLSARRTFELARSWAAPARCQDQTLNEWFIARTSEAIRRGDDEGQMMVYWTALERADSPQIRDYLRGLLLDPLTPVPIRQSAGGALYARFTSAEAEAQFLKDFETERLPYAFAEPKTYALSRVDPDGLAHGVADRVRANPRLMIQYAFTAAAWHAQRSATADTRRYLAAAMAAGLADPSIPEARRHELQMNMRDLTGDD